MFNPRRGSPSTHFATHSALLRCHLQHSWHPTSPHARPVGLQRRLCSRQRSFAPQTVHLRAKQNCLFGFKVPRPFWIIEAVFKRPTPRVFAYVLIWRALPFERGLMRVIHRLRLLTLLSHQTLSNLEELKLAFSQNVSFLSAVGLGRVLYQGYQSELLRSTRIKFHRFPKKWGNKITVNKRKIFQPQVISQPKTSLQLPPFLGSPQVITDPSALSAANAPLVAKISVTSRSSWRTSCESPPEAFRPGHGLYDVNRDIRKHQKKIKHKGV